MISKRDNYAIRKSICFGILADVDIILIDSCGQQQSAQRSELCYYISNQMTQERIAQLQSSVEFLREKNKANDLARTALENRLSLIENKIVGLANVSCKVEKENLSTFDSQLSASHLFVNTLRKVDNNSTANLRKLEDHFGQLILEAHSKFEEIQEKLLGMMTQKQKILRNMNFQMENQGHAITAIEQWIRTDHDQANSVHILEENIRQKVEMIQKNNDIKADILDQKIKYLEQFKESIQNSIRNIGTVKEEVEDQLKQTKKQLKKQIMQINERIEASVQRDGQRDKIKDYKQELTAVRDDLEELAKKIKKQSDRIVDLESTHDRLQNKIVLIQKVIDQSEKHPANLPNQPKNNLIHERVSSSVSQRKQEYQSNSYSKQTPNATSSKNLIGDLPRAEKKELPPRKNLFSEQNYLGTQEDLIPPVTDMRGGVRGLLQKSKEKQRNQPKVEESFGRPKTGSRRGLPPVRQDSASKKRQTQSKNVREKQLEQQDEAMVYQIDEEGYLMDESGNYLTDELGNMIRLSPQEIEEYTQEQQY